MACALCANDVDRIIIEVLLYPEAYAPPNLAAAEMWILAQIQCWEVVAGGSGREWRGLWREACRAWGCTRRSQALADVASRDGVRKALADVFSQLRRRLGAPRLVALDEIRDGKV